MASRSVAVQVKNGVGYLHFILGMFGYCSGGVHVVFTGFAYAHVLSCAELTLAYACHSFAYATTLQSLTRGPYLNMNTRGNRRQIGSSS